MAPIQVAMIRHQGSYDQIGPKFEQLWGWVESNNIPAKRSIGIYWDNPDFVPVDQLRSAACAEVPIGSNVGSLGPGIEMGQIPGGNYVTSRHVGPYSGLGAAWGQLVDYIEKYLKKTISDNPAFEVYVNDPSDTPEDQLITELYMPVN